VRSQIRLNTTLVGLLLAVSSPLAASSFKGVILKGIVVENEAGGQPIASVQISAQDGANAVLSLSNGTFVLEVAKQPGELVRLILQKPGMVVVNDWEREFNLPRPENARPLTFLLCRKSDFPEMKRRYYRVDGIDRTAKEKDSEVKRKAAGAEKERLRPQPDQQAAMPAPVNNVARVKADEPSASTVQGVSSADRSPDAMMLNRDAKLYRDENRPEEALKAYNKALTVSRERARQDPNTYLPDVADTLNNRGDLLSELNRFSEALKDFNEALQTSRDLAQKSSTYLPYVAMTQDNRAALFHKQNRAKDERAALDDALQLYSGLAPANPTYWSHVAETLNKLGINNLDKERREEKRDAFNDALKIYQRLERENPGEYGQEIESTRGLLEELFNETLESYGELPKLDPRYRPNVAETLSNLGYLNLDQNRIGRARKNLSESFGIYVTLATENLGQYGERALSIEGTLSRINPGPYQKEFESSGRVLEAAFNDSLKSYRKQAETDPRYRSNVAGTLVSLGKLARDQNRIADARDDFSQALEIFEPLALAEKQHPGPAPWYGSQYDGKVKSTRGLLDDLMEMRRP
jgi:tetratricopeptide (TPR) repeat protein